MYDSVSRKVWAIKGSKPKRIVTGLHKRVHIFGFLSEDKKRMFSFSDEMNAKAFLNNVYKLKSKFKKVILIIDSAPWHRKSKKVRKYLKENKEEIKIIWLPKGCPEMNPVEECWRQAKKEVNGGRVHERFEMMKKELRHFLKYQDFKQDMVKYLRP